MILINDLTFNFGGQLLFKDVDLKFTPGNGCNYRQGKNVRA